MAEATVQTESRRPGHGARRLGTARAAVAMADHAWRYSRFVGRAKLVLPSIAGALILTMIVWPYLSAGIDRLRTDVPVLDAAVVRDLRMVHPHYTGIDRNERPFTLNAETAHELPQNEALMSLEAPKAQLQTKAGSWLVITGDTGVFQPEAHKLDAFGHVTLFHGKGYFFSTHSAHIDLAEGSAFGEEPVTGNGPSGHIHGDGFRVLHSGDIITVTGHAELTMSSASGKHR